MEGLTRVGVLRRERGLTQQELGRRSGLSSSFLSQVENGNRVPSLSSLTRISAALGVIPIEVLVRDEREISEKNEDRTRTSDRRRIPSLGHIVPKERLRLANFAVPSKRRLGSTVTGDALKRESSRALYKPSEAALRRLKTLAKGWGGEATALTHVFQCRTFKWSTPGRPSRVGPARYVRRRPERVPSPSSHPAGAGRRVRHSILAGFWARRLKLPGGGAQRQRRGRLRVPGRFPDWPRSARLRRQRRRCGGRRDLRSGCSPAPVLRHRRGRVHGLPWRRRRGGCARLPRGSAGGHRARRLRRLGHLLRLHGAQDRGSAGNRGGDAGGTRRLR